VNTAKLCLAIANETRRRGMNVAERRAPSRSTFARRTHERTVLVLQDGGGLRAPWAEVYEGLAEAGMAPDWVAGVSLGAINLAPIAGNPPDRRDGHFRAARAAADAPSVHGTKSMKAVLEACPSWRTAHRAPFAVPVISVSRRSDPASGTPAATKACPLSRRRVLPACLRACPIGLLANTR
jgi:NTE family protein